MAESNSTRLRSLHPALALRVWAMIGRLADQGITIRVLYGYRSHEKQQELFDLWKAKKGGKAVAPGLSWHNYGLACDMVPFDDLDHDLMLDANELDWNTKLWVPFGKAATSLGLIWGKSFNDSPHVEWHPGYGKRIRPSQMPALATIAKTKSYWGMFSYAKNGW